MCVLGIHVCVYVYVMCIHIYIMYVVNVIVVLGYRFWTQAVSIWWRSLALQVFLEHFPGTCPVFCISYRFINDSSLNGTTEDIVKLYNNIHHPCKKMLNYNSLCRTLQISISFKGLLYSYSRSSPLLIACIYITFIYPNIPISHSYMLVLVISLDLYW